MHFGRGGNLNCDGGDKTTSREFVTPQRKGKTHKYFSVGLN